MPWKDPDEWRKHRIPEKHAATQRKYTASHPGESTVYRRRLRIRAVQALGGVCISCGYKDNRALEIHHVFNDGKLDKNGRRHGMLMSIVRNGAQGKYELLCANCHQIRTHEEVWTRWPGLEN
jgi:hypothetical protein